MSYRSYKHSMSWVAILPLLVGAVRVAASPQQTVGVALEGGGAMGLAHIGVLKWFEEHRIPIEFVAGTSMGGLVGGMYATGMKPSEITQLVGSIDWDVAFRRQLPYQDLSYRRKEDRREFQNYLQLGLRGGLTLSSGLNSGQEVTSILDQATLPYSHLESFDQLPIPFRCVATDLSSGKPYVFHNGPLGEALRSSMSLPGIFSPVRRGDRLYADGALLDNLPVDVVRQMGANVVIGVHLKQTEFDPHTNPSILGVMDRSITVSIGANELRSMESADILLSVDVGGFTALGFKAADSLIARGYAAAAEKAAVLSRFQVDEATWQRYLDGRERRKIKDVPVPEIIQVTGVDQPMAEVIQSALASNAGKPVDTKSLKRTFDLLSGTGRYSQFSYSMSNVDGKPALVVHADRYYHGPPFLNLGTGVDGSDYKNVRFTLFGRVTAMDVAGPRSEWRTDFSAGSTWGIGTELYRPLNATSRWFIAPRMTAANSSFDLYNHSDRIAEYRLSRFGGGVDVGYAISRSSEIRAGYEIGQFGSSLSVGVPILPTPSGRIGTTGIRYDFDELDSPLVPRKGQALRFRGQWFDAYPGSTGGFPSSELYVAVVRPISRPASVYVQAFAGSTLGYHYTGLPQFFLGGAQRLTAYGTNELRTNQYFLGRLGYIHEIFSLPPLIGNKVYITSAYEVAKASRVPGQSAVPMDVAVAMVAETFAGPLAFGAALGDTGHRKWYFQIGRIF